MLKDEDGQYGFVFHDSCWLLLKERFQRRTFSLDRLIEVLNSVPWEQWGNYSWSGERYYAWEHGYHGLVEFDHKNYYPWESAGWQQVGGLRTIQIDTIDPCTVNGIQKLLDSPSVLPPDVGKRKGRMRNNFTPSTTSTAAQRASANEQRTPRNDCFTQLPYEMVEEIAAHLPTSSVLSLRLISPEFTPLFHSQSFWATRFQAGRERGFRFEIWQDPKRRDWRTLYYLTNPTNLPQALQNRKRVWDLVESLGQKVSLEWADSSTRLRTEGNLGGSRLMEVYGDLIEVEESEPASYEPSQVLDPQETLIPRKVSKFGVSIIHDGDTSYIAGIQIVPEGDGRTIYLGYTGPEVTTCIDVNCVKGLITSVGTGGIHALQVVMDNDSLSPWLGNPDRGAITRRLVFAKQIVALAAAFDVSLR